MDKSNIMRRKPALWALSSLVVSFLFLAKIKIPSLSYLQSCGLYPWAVLLLCALWLYKKKDEQKELIQAESEKSPDLQFVLLGLAILATAILMPRDVEPAAVVFELLLAFLGLYVMLFGRAAMMPGILIGIYGFSAGFPGLIAKYMDMQYSLATLGMVTPVLKTIGFQFIEEGRVIEYVSASGTKIAVIVDSACSGSASITLFISIFALMMLDVRLPKKPALYMLAFGIIGTTIQNVIRIISIILAGYYYDFRGVMLTHAYGGYILFPAWFLIFAYVYFMYAKKLSQDA